MKDSADHSPPSPSPVEEKKKIAEARDSENVDPADAESTASPRNKVEQVDESTIEDANEPEERYGTRERKDVPLRVYRAGATTSGDARVEHCGFQTVSVFVQ